MLKTSSLQQFDFTKWIQKEILIRICGTKVPLLAYMFVEVEITATTSKPVH